ncbi:MAG: hypothetical protein KJ804_05230 [Proteobacteria bacterium]|nr:hypothetical protein [Pseudomonadota bacterium]MBU1057706.1 hypothetical protein [Pseudomonadota bacterium]
MNWNIKSSMKLKEKIADNPKVMKQLTERIEALFKEYKIKMPGMSYVFEPRVFSMDSQEAPEVLHKSRAAMLSAIIEDLAVEHAGNKMDEAIDMSKYTACLPQCGPMDPVSLNVLEKLRISKVVDDDLVPIISSENLMRRIVGNKKLMQALSESLFAVLQEVDIKFNQREGCVFTPIVFQTPVFAQKVGLVGDISEMQGFGPQLYASADPTPEPSFGAMKPFPGIIEIRDKGFIPGVVINRWWWIGIPAPELLRALDLVRQYR